MAPVEILEVRQQRPRDERLRGCHIDLPRAGSFVEGPAVTLAGWALTAGGPALAVELACDNAVFRRVPTGQSRPDLNAAFPDVPGAENAGFQMTGVPLLGQQEYEVRAVLPGQARAPLGSVRLRRAGAGSGPLVSVVIPCYRQARYLGEAIESAVGQTHPHLEVVVVDDGSPDNTAAITAHYPGVIHLRQPNGGLSAARNAGLRRSNGAFVVFLDADDRLLPEAVEAGLACFQEHPECAFVYGQFHYITSDGTYLCQPRREEPGKDYYRALLTWNYIQMHAAVMYRRDIFQEVSGFDETMRSCEDYDLYLRITRRRPVCSHDRVIAEYRRHGTNMTNNPGRILQFAMTALRAQWTYVKGNRRLREAYRTGMKFWQQTYGEQLMAQVQSEMKERRRRQATATLHLALRYFPRGLSSLLPACDD